MKTIIASRVFDKKYPDFFQKLDLVLKRSKIQSFLVISKIPTRENIDPKLAREKKRFFDIFRDPSGYRNWGDLKLESKDSFLKRSQLELLQKIRRLFIKNQKSYNTFWRKVKICSYLCLLCPASSGSHGSKPVNSWLTSSFFTKPSLQTQKVCQWC